jgi:predicted phage-related endonuclease
MIEKWRITDRQEWLAWRRQDLTASDVAAAIGLDPHHTAAALYAEKCGRISSRVDTPAMQRGRWMEAAVVAALAEQQPHWRIKYPLNIYLRDGAIKLAATPDALAEIPGIEGICNLQFKVVSRPVFERDWIQEPPLGYTLQTLCEGMLLDAAENYLVALVVDTYSAELELFPIERNPAAEAKIKDIATTFWDNIRTGKLPAIDYSRDADTIDRLYPTSRPEPVLDLSGDNSLAKMLPVRAMFKAERDELDAAINAIDTEVKSKLGEHERAELPGWKISWKTQHRKEHLVKAYSYRPLLVTKSREKEQAA